MASNVECTCSRVPRFAGLIRANAHQKVMQERTASGTFRDPLIHSFFSFAYIAVASMVSTPDNNAQSAVKKDVD